MKSVKGNGVFILCIDNQRKGFHIAIENARCGICEQYASQTLALKALIDGQTAKQSSRKNRIARQSL